MTQMLERVPLGGLAVPRPGVVRARRAWRPWTPALVDLAGALLVAAPLLSGTAATALPVIWVVLLALTGCYATTVLPGAAPGLRAPVEASLGMVVVVEVAAATVLPGERIRLLVWIALALGVTLLARVLRWAHVRLQRLRGRAPTRRAVVVGTAADVRRVLGDLEASPLAGVDVVAVCLAEPADEALPAATVLGHQRLPEAVAEFGADLVLAVPCHQLTPAGLRRLAWSLETTGTELLVATGLPDVAARRTRMAVTGSVPLLHVRRAQLSGGRRLLKELWERPVALAILLLAAPLLLTLMTLVRLESAGPAVFRQRRIGRDGRDFTMYKLRTMVTGADRRVLELAECNEADGVLFKVRSDPRVTRLGGILRRYSLDELPQLWNVVRGDMALIGPRPALPGEVAGYDDDVRRRLAVKPGLTGLWQVSGRSDLSWNRTVQLDLHYVDNWSLGLDLTILLRTVRAVLGHAGAY